MAQSLSHFHVDALFEAAGAAGIRHRAQRAIYERRTDTVLAQQVAAVASALEADRRFAPVVNELRSHVAALQPPAPGQWVVNHGRA